MGIRTAHHKTLLLEVGRYIDNIVNIYFRYRYIGIVSALYISVFRYIDIVSMISKISVIFRYFIILYPDFLMLI